MRASSTDARSPSAPGSSTDTPLTRLDQQRLQASAGDQLGQRGCRRRAWASASRSERQQCPSAALEEPHQLTVDQHHQRARLAPGSVSRSSVSVGHGSAAPYGLAGSAAARTTACTRGARRRRRRGRCAAGRRSTRPRTGRRPATRRSSRVGSGPPPRTPQHLVEHRETARHALGRTLGQHAVAVQQQLGLRSGPGSSSPARPDGSADQRPATVGSAGPGLRVARRCSGSGAAAVGAAGARRPGGPARPAARTGAKVSPVTQPAQISSHSAAFERSASADAAAGELAEEVGRHRVPRVVQDLAVRVGELESRWPAPASAAPCRRGERRSSRRCRRSARRRTT